MRKSPVIPLVLVFLVSFVSSAVSADGPSAAPAAPTNARPYLAPWIVVTAESAKDRLDALHALSPSPLTPNAPGILLEVSPDAYGAAPSLQAARDLVISAHRGGRRAGLAVTLAHVPVPTDARSAEAASAETIYPGLGRLIKAAAGADLFDLELPGAGEDLQARTFALRKVAAEIRAANPSVVIAVSFPSPGTGALFPASAPELLSAVTAAYIDLVGLRLPESEPSPETVRAAVDALAFGRPLLVRAPRQPDADALLALAARFASIGAPFVAAPVDAPPEKDAELDRFAKLVAGDFAHDGRAAEARYDGGTLPVTRLVSGTDLGGVVLVPAAGWRGPITLTLDSPSYLAAEVVELASGRSKRFDIPRTAEAPRLTLSTANGSIAVRLTAREKAPSEAAKAAVGVSAERGITVEEILAKHQAWRARRDARWKRLAARNETSIRFRFADFNTTFELTLGGPFFYEPGKGYDWAWHDAYFNGVKWRGKKIPQLPLLQPEKVSELPLALTFNDTYVYTLHGVETVNGVRCYALDFEPKETVSVKALYAGRVFIATSDFAFVRTETRQLNLTGEVQSVDEASDFSEVPAPDGGEPLRFPTHTKGQWVARTFSRTTVLERETFLKDIRLDPPTYDEEKTAAFASPDVMVRDTDKGVRYLEKTKEGERVVVEDAKSARLFGLGGVFYDSSLSYPLPLLGAYYLDLDFRKKHQQLQVFWGGVLLAASFNEPRLFGTQVDLGGDVFGIAVKGTDSFYVNGEEDKSQRVKQQAFVGNVNVGYPIARHVKLTASLGSTYVTYSRADETAPSFRIPSDNFTTHLKGQVIWDVGGYALSARYIWNKRSSWDPWGTPGNPDYDPGKDHFDLYSVTLQKDFAFTGFRRFRTSIAYLGSSNTDRFSKYSFGFFGSTSLRGFRSNSLRAEQAFVSRNTYGIVFGDALRLEAVYDHALVKDPAAGLDWVNFGGAGVSGQVPGPWSTIIQLDAGLPVVGRSHGQTGFVLNLVFLKIF